MTGFDRAYDQWLDAQDHANSDYEWAFQEAREQLMNHKYNPHYLDVFMDALYECDLNGCAQELAQAIAMGESGYEKIGRVFWHAVYSHLDSLAKIDAKKQCEAIRDFI